MLAVPHCSVSAVGNHNAGHVTCWGLETARLASPSAAHEKELSSDKFEKQFGFTREVWQFLY